MGRAHELAVDVATGLRPRMRGVLHRWAVPVAVVLTVVVVVRASTAGSRATVVIYGCCVTAMLAVSAIYHAPRFVGNHRRWLLRRLDHSAILLAIAGSYTAVIVFALDGTARIVLLVATWVVAAVGVTIRMVWFDAPAGLVAAVYLAAGWMALVYLPGFVGGMSSAEFALVVAGGMAYTVGAAVFALKRPNPWPATFGFHEIFHSFVVVAALCHWMAIFSLSGA